jgi:hypothetical protein
MDLVWETYEIWRDSDSLEIEGLADLRELAGRYVYVIEVPKILAISYPKGCSHICYIGRQAVRASERSTRAYAHAGGWIARYLILSGNLEPFRIHVCHPRRRGDYRAFIEIEAYLIETFDSELGRKPLFNKRGETTYKDYPININAPFKFKRRSKPMIKAVDTVNKELLDM